MSIKLIQHLMQQLTLKLYKLVNKIKAEFNIYLTKYSIYQKSNYSSNRILVN